MRKEKLGIFLLIMAFFLSFNIIKADGILDFLDYAENAQDKSFGYTSDDSLTIKNLSNSSVDIESPAIKNGSTDITAYLFNVSEESRANENPVAFRCFYDLNINGNKFIVNLDMSSLNKEKTYYVYAIPVDLLAINGTNGPCSASEAKDFLSSGIPGKESTTNGEDPCFNINANVYGEGTYCEDHNSGNNGSNGGGTTEIYSISNVSHICNNNGTTTITWQSFANVNIDVYLRSDSKELFEKQGTINSERKSFTFTPKDKDGHFSVRLEPVDGTQKINYDGHCLVKDTPEVTPVTPIKTPVVGPKENILMILFGTVILYIIYKIAVRKRS